MPVLYALPGAEKLLNESNCITQEAIDGDQEEETDSYNSTLELDNLIEAAETGNTYQLPNPDKEGKRRRVDPSELVQRLKEASQNVVVQRTLDEYARYWRQFTEFCTEQGWVNEKEDVEKLFPDFPKEMPQWIAIWIMHKCDDTNIFTGKAKDPSEPRPTIGTAQKMRAAMTHKFGREFGLGTQPWMQNPLTGKYMGNPSLSVTVGQYMVSLGRRKIHAGEVVTSARAMTEATLNLLWIYNVTFKLTVSIDVGTNSRKEKEKNPEQWGGWNIRAMLQLLYTISMLCLLRYDEALRIMWSDVFFEKVDGRIWRVRLMLPFRKTHQNGGIAPFYLYCNLEKPWLCPVRAFARWYLATKNMFGTTPTGYVFRKRVGIDRVSSNPADAMSSESFLECFRNNLLDIKIDPRPYGTHSFRRGGCQYLAMVLRWPFRNICTWGGWAPDFDNPGTIFKYLLSWTDTPFLEREDYFNPERRGSDPCTACGRTCLCA